MKRKPKNEIFSCAKSKKKTKLYDPTNDVTHMIISFTIRFHL